MDPVANGTRRACRASAGAVVCLLVALLNPAAVRGFDKELVVLDSRSQVFQNSDCRKTASCGLKRVEWVVENYKVGVGDQYNYGTRFYARYATDALNHLEDYAFVQFIRGTVFFTRIRNGRERPEDTAYVYHFGKYKPFDFHHWVVDSDSADPIYSSIPDGPRFFLCRWNLVPGSFDSTTARFYGQAPCPDLPEMYVSDHPGTAFESHGRAKNISLEFRTCIYRTSDVPRSIAPTDTDFAAPLACYGWNSSFLYNVRTGDFEHVAHIVYPKSGRKRAASRRPGKPKNPAVQSAKETPSERSPAPRR
jgi:hypothetical protein